MCETCGCGKTEGFVILDPGGKDKPGSVHSHGKEHIHEHDQHQDHDDVHNHLHHHHHHHDPDASSGKVIDLGVDILARNNITAALNRRFFEGRKVFCLNLVSSPGSGKTTLLEKTISHPGSPMKFYVIEGDQQTTIDAERIEKTGASVIQVNTDSGCHLDAFMVEAALNKLDIGSDSVLFIENVGNLVCPAMFDLGENKRVLIISVTEGEDKPLKYPYMFESSNLCIINKSDLLPYVDFHTDALINNARAVNPSLEFLLVSATKGEGLSSWYDWISAQKELFLNRCT